MLSYIRASTSYLGSTDTVEQQHICSYLMQQSDELDINACAVGAA